MQLYALGPRVTRQRQYHNHSTERRRAVYHSGDNQTRHSRRGPNHICVYCPPPDARRGPKHIRVYFSPINPNPRKGHSADLLADGVLPLHLRPLTQIAPAYTGLSDPLTLTRITQLAAGLALPSKSPRRCPKRRPKAHLCIMTPPRTAFTRILTAGAEPAVPLRPDARHTCVYGWQLANPPNPPSLDPQRLAMNERHATNRCRITTLHFLRSEPPWMLSP